MTALEEVRRRLVADRPGMVLALSAAADGSIAIDLILVPAAKRRCGWASEAMAALVAAADESAVTMRLTAAGLFCVSTSVLVAFYRRYGFRVTRTGGADGVRMLRKPSPLAALAVATTEAAA